MKSDRAAKKAAYMALYFAARKDEKRAYDAAYRESNRERRRAYSAGYNAGHRDAQRAAAKAWREAHREESRASASAYAKAHPDATRERGHRATAKRQGAALCDHPACLAIGPVALAWQTNPHVCHMCGTPVWEGVNLHMDHVLPISRGGLHCAANLRPACAPCNLSKGSKEA